MQCNLILYKPANLAMLRIVCNHRVLLILHKEDVLMNRAYLLKLYNILHKL